MEIAVDAQARKLGIYIASWVLEDVRVRETRKEVFDLLVVELKKELKERFQTLDRLPGDPTIRALRNLYWRMGIDPTKTRPSSEALIRRLFRKGIPRINSLVDAGNLASARSLIPIGLYDLDRLDGEIVLRLSGKKEVFHGIGSSEEIIEEGIPVMADDSGIVHLYPHRDCMRTRITEDAGNVLAVACGAKGIGPKELDWSLEQVVHYDSQLRE